MRHLPFQAVAFDLDDTLLHNDLTISDYTISVLRRLSGLGVHIIPASGRAQLSMKPFVDQLACSSIYISCNGAEIWSGQTDELLHAEQFSKELGQEIASFGNHYSVYSQTYAGDKFYYNEESEWSRQYAEASMLTGILVGNLESFIQEPRSKILMMAAPEKISVMLQAARKIFDGRASVTCSKPWFLEFNPVHATKGAALSRASSILTLPPSSFIAFGDSLNDLSMLQFAGRGVLMFNGREDMRFICDDICGSNQEDGVPHYLENLYREVLS